MAKLCRSFIMYRTLQKLTFLTSGRNCMEHYKWIKSVNQLCIRTLSSEHEHVSAAFDRRIGLTKSEQQKIARQKLQQPPEPYMLKVAILGPPNAGKSTLANQLLGWRFSAVSKKVHTTRNNSIGVLTEGNSQIVFLDTPGLTNSKKVKKHNLERTLLTDPYSSLFEADLILAVIDVSKVWHRTRIDPDVLTALTLHRDKRSVLILNKVDILKTKSDLLTTARLLSNGVIGGKTINHEKVHNQPKTLEDFLEKMDSSDVDDDESPSDTDESSDVIGSEAVQSEEGTGWWKAYNKLLRRTRRQTDGQRGWPGFDQVFMVSAIDGNGVSDIKDYLWSCVRPAPWQYPPTLITDQDPRDLARMCVWEKLLDHLPHEIPYHIDVRVSTWVIDENDVLRVIVDLICSKKRHVIHLLGSRGATIRRISLEAKQELMNTFHTEMTLHLNVRTPSRPVPK